jgi:hypothetical protein
MDPFDHKPRVSGINHSSRILSMGPMGRVYVCRGGCLHVDTGTVSLRFSPREYRDLVAMLSHAASELSREQESTVH